jgi:hypothetical protein
LASLGTVVRGAGSGGGVALGGASAVAKGEAGERDSALLVVGGTVARLIGCCRWVGAIGREEPGLTS